MFRHINVQLSLGDAPPANTPHRPGPGKATVQRLRCRSVSPPAPAQRLVFARVEQYSRCMQT